MRSSCPFPRLDWDDTKWCEQCKTIAPFKNKIGCLLHNNKKDRTIDEFSR